MKASISHKHGICFEATIRDKHHFILDSAQLGSKDEGPSPKEFLLASIAGCSAMDVVSLLRKYKVTFETLDCTAEGELTAEHPKIFKEVLLSFIVNGKDIDASKVKEAVDLSLSKYCGVSAMVHPTSPVVYKIMINGAETAAGSAQF